MATDGSSTMDFESGLGSESGASEISNFSTFDDFFTTLAEQLVSDERIIYKSQQRDEADITPEEKLLILRDIFNKSKSAFLTRFGSFMSDSQLATFEHFAQDDGDDTAELPSQVRHIKQLHSVHGRHKRIRNRRYAALKRLENDGTYFSEIEMMKRNPLLYEQLVGQYLSAKERKMRDFQSSVDRTFVGVLMNGIEREQAKQKKEKQMEEENNLQDSDSDDEDNDEEFKCSEGQKPIKILWGEMHSEVPKRTSSKKKNENDLFITARERDLLREEFVSSMYENFLDGKDDEFDYEVIDNDDRYDNLDIIEHDEEEKYFDSEEPDDDDLNQKEQVQNESSEDELDIYMNALNQHPAVCALSENLKEKL